MTDRLHLIREEQQRQTQRLLRTLMKPAKLESAAASEDILESMAHTNHIGENLLRGLFILGDAGIETYRHPIFAIIDARRSEAEHYRPQTLSHQFIQVSYLTLLAVVSYYRREEDHLTNFVNAQAVLVDLLNKRGIQWGSTRNLTRYQLFDHLIMGLCFDMINHGAVSYAQADIMKNDHLESTIQHRLTAVCYHAVTEKRPTPELAGQIRRLPPAWLDAKTNLSGGANATLLCLVMIALTKTIGEHQGLADLLAVLWAPE